MRMAMVSGLVASLLAVPVAAEEDGGALAKAKVLAEAGQYVEAVTLCADELAIAQKQKDLMRQMEVRDALDDGAFHRLALLDQQATYVACLKILLTKLDPKTTSAACSAGQVSHALLYEATRTGNMGHVAAAAEGARAYAKQKTGAHAKLMATYAGALEQIAAGQAAKACRELTLALRTATDEQWSYAAVHLATELAAAHLASGAEAEAKAAIATGAEALEATGERAVFQVWREMIRVRLPETPDDVLAPYAAIAERWNAAGSAGAPGGAGGAGRPPGARSKLGAAWKKLSKKKPFVSVARTGTGFRMTESFDKRFAREQEYGTGVKHVDDGGITVGLFDRGVTLVMLDMIGNKGAPGASTQPGPFQFFTPIARDETWGVTRSGSLVVK